MNVQDLPLETLERMTSFVDPNDIVTLRLACKKLEKAATSKFIEHFIRCRRHVVSAYSLKILVQIASHPYFGQFVEVVILDTDFVIKKIVHGHIKDVNEPLGWVSIRNLIHQVLSQLKVHENAITLGVTDYKSIRYGMKPALNHETHYPACFGESHTICLDGMKHLLSRHITNQLRRERHEVFRCLLRNAKSIKLRIKGLKLELAEDPDPRSNICTDEATNFAEETAQMIAHSPDLISFSIEVARLAWDVKDVGVLRDQQNKSLDVTDFIEWDSRSVYRNMVHPLLHNMTWVAAAKVTKLTLTDCRCRDSVDYSRFKQFIQACLKTLKSIRISVMLLRNEAKWSAVLYDIVPTPHLENIELAGLEREIWSPGNLELQYASILQVEKWCCSGDKVTTELEDLAAAVEADESAWGSIEDDHPEKWTYHTTGRNKSS